MSGNLEAIFAKQKKHNFFGDMDGPWQARAGPIHMFFFEKQESLETCFFQQNSANYRRPTTKI